MLLKFGDYCWLLATESQPPLKESVPSAGGCTCCLLACLRELICTQMF